MTCDLAVVVPFGLFGDTSQIQSKLVHFWDSPLAATVSFVSLQRFVLPVHGGTADTCSSTIPGLKGALCGLQDCHPEVGMSKLSP